MSLRALSAFVLVVLLSLAVCGAESWRSKVAPSVLRWVDSGATTERELLLRLAAAGGAGSASSSYAGASHVAWLVDDRAMASEMELWAQWVDSFALRRASASPWEIGLPYVHALRSVLVRTSVGGARQLAQLGSVAAILDATAGVPAPGVFSPGESSGASSTPPSPNSFLSCGLVAGSDLEAWMSALGWRYVSLADVGFSESLDTPLTLSATEPSAAVDHEVVGLAMPDETRRWIESGGVALADALASASWASARAFSPTVVDLVCLVEAMGQAGADAAGIATVAIRGELVNLYILLRSAAGAGWASLAMPGVGVSTTQDALPRGEAPGEVTATPGSYVDRVVVQWQSVPGGSSYEVLRAQPGSGTYEPIGIASGNSFEDTEVESCLRYAYATRLIDPSGVGMESRGVVGFIGEVPMPSSSIWTDGGVEPGAIRIEWTPSEGATRYQLMRTEPMTDKPQVAAQQYLVYDGVEPNFVDTDVIAGQRHLYRVFSLNGCGKSELSDPTQGAALYELPPDTTRLDPPAWVEATRGRPYERVELSWRAAPGATGYRVLRAPSYQGAYAIVAETNQTSWTDRDVVLCGDYWYRVQSVAGTTSSEPSPVIYGSYGYRPEAPEGVHATSGTYGNSIVLTWQPMADAQQYNVARAPAHNGPFATIADGIIGTTYVDLGLVPGQEFWYKVRASNACGCSGDLGPVYGATAPK